MIVTCSKCHQTMERGYSLVMAGQPMLTSWNPGEPKRRRFFGWIVWRRDESIPITVYRCKGCGFLESYATPAVT